MERKEEMRGRTPAGMRKGQRMERQQLDIGRREKNERVRIQG